MGPVVHSISANSGDSVGVRQSTALLGGTQPERALVFLARAREDNGSERGKGTMIDTTSMNAVGAASACPAPRARAGCPVGQLDWAPRREVTP